MTLDLSTLEARAKRGELTGADIMRAYKFVSDLDMLNMATQSEIRARQRRMAAHRRAVESYSVAMAPVFGLDASLPNGDKI